MKDETDDERQLARLADATAGLGPSADFVARVMTAVEAEPRRLRLGRERIVALSLFAAAAAAAIFVALGAQTSLDERALSAFDVVELEP